jgi:hypothetical protein
MIINRLEIAAKSQSKGTARLKRPFFQGDKNASVDMVRQRIQADGSRLRKTVGEICLKMLI